MIILGRIKTKDIKDVGNETLKMAEDKFNSDFESNKKQVDELGFKISKRVRNRLAGYITRQKKIKLKSNK